MAAKRARAARYLEWCRDATAVHRLMLYGVDRSLPPSAWLRSLVRWEAHLAFDAELGRVMRQAVEARGFELSVPYASREAMTLGIRTIATLPAGAILSYAQRDALLENFRRTVVTTMADGRVDSIAAQSRLSRWAFLRQASNAAADG